MSYTINIRFNTSPIHILQSVAASRGGGGGDFPSNMPLICPLEYLAVLKLFILVLYAVVEQHLVDLKLISQLAFA